MILALVFKFKFIEIEPRDFMHAALSPVLQHQTAPQAHWLLPGAASYVPLATHQYVLLSSGNPEGSLCSEAPVQSEAGPKAWMQLMPGLLLLLHPRMLIGHVGFLRSVMECYESLQGARCSVHLSFLSATCIPQIT